MPAPISSSDRIVELSLSSWAEIRFHVLKLLEVDHGNLQSRFLFRGQISSTWGLIASFDRLTIDGEPDRRKSMYERYTSELRDDIEGGDYVELPNYLRFAKIDSSLVIEMLAQHHGAPTRILDWSASPYIALFFSIFGAASLDPGHAPAAALWILDGVQLTKLVGSDSCEIIRIQAAGNSRSIAQHGRFTRNKSIFADLVEMIEKSPHSKTPRTSPVLYKFIIPRELFPEIRLDLSLMGIDMVRMFPGIESVCTFHRERLLAELHP
jgi:FRG domain